MTGEIRAAAPGPDERCPEGAPPLPLRCPCGGTRFYPRALAPPNASAGVWLRCARCGSDYSGLSVGVADAITEFSVSGTISCGYDPDSTGGGS